jgi:hypothetical protein
MSEVVVYDPEEDDDFDLKDNKDVWYWLSLMLDVLLGDKK